MANQTPIFLTGACAVISIAGQKLAFAKGISYQIRVPHSNSKVLGMYESADIQPQSYDVNGSFSVHRYVQGIKDVISQETPSASVNHPSVGEHNTAVAEGNGVGTFGESGIKSLLYGSASDNFNPAYLMYGTMFDIAIYQTSGAKNKNLVPLVVLRNCRLVTSELSIMKREIASQTFQFIANYVDEDSFISGFSGTGGGW